MNTFGIIKTVKYKQTVNTVLKVKKRFPNALTHIKGSTILGYYKSFVKKICIKKGYNMRLMSRKSLLLIRKLGELMMINKILFKNYIIILPAWCWYGGGVFQLITTELITRFDWNSFCMAGNREKILTFW